MRLTASLLAAVLLCACVAIAMPDFDKLFGPEQPTRFDTPLAPSPGESYAQRIQPILDRRCVACHACYDAPCQFKTTSWDGLARGADKTPVYNATRLTAAQPSRLYVDAQKPSEWRDRGFHAVLNERAQTPEANRTVGLMQRLLALKQRHPLPAEGVVGGGLDFSIDRAAMCPSEGEIDRYERDAPLAGMPFGLPGLSASEHATLTNWLQRGAPYEGPPAPTPLAMQRVAMWENFLNGDSLRERLFSRYAFEHLFIAHLYFDDDPARQFFKVVRSSTPPGQPVVQIVTRRPVDHPGVARPYYRLVPERETIVSKTHMPYALGAARMARWRSLFLDAPYPVDALPGYSEDTAANPFATFAALPVGARYRFMLEEAEFTIMGFIKGPVCRGQLALDVIDDRFWVTFLAPSPAYDAALSTLLARAAPTLRLPTGSSSTDGISWFHYAGLEADYMKTRTDLLANTLRDATNLDLRLIWDGDGTNSNAALTVFRHFDSASVVRGLVGSEPPKTAWVIGYPLLERLHYLLVADYDVYGNVGHQLDSRLYMDFLRMEGEFNFLTLLPVAQRNATRDFWYRGDSQATREQVYGGAGTTLPIDSGIRYATTDASRELMTMLKARLSPVRETRWDSWNGSDSDASVRPASLQAGLRALAAVRGSALQWMPEASLLIVESPGQPAATFSVLRNSAHASVSHLLGEARELRPDEHTLTVAAGVIGSYPNAFLRAPAADLPALASAIAGLRSESDYAAFARRWVVRRNNPGFWAMSDGVLDRFAVDQPLEAGVLDLNRLENR